MTAEPGFGPWALIVGGSEGVGASFARKLAERRVNVVLVARKIGPLEETAAAVRALGVGVRVLSLDVTTDGSVDTIAGACEGLEIGTLICNAGASHGVARALDQPLERSLAMLRLNCESTLRLVHHFGGRMQSRGTGGNIVLIGSGAGFGGTAGVAAYSAAKAFVHTFAEALWYELAPRNIRVLGLVLGLTDTPAMARAGMRPGGGFLADDPDVVAETGLREIAHGPIIVMPGIRPYLESLQGLPRAEVVKAMSRATVALQRE